MKIATISQTKNNLSALLDQVKRGTTVLIVDRDRPVARLEPAHSHPQIDERASRLERAGVLRRGLGRRVTAILQSKPPKARRDVDIVDVLLQNRQDRT